MLGLFFHVWEQNVVLFLQSAYLKSELKTRDENCSFNEKYIVDFDLLDIS